MFELGFVTISFHTSCTCVLLSTKDPRSINHYIGPLIMEFLIGLAQALLTSPLLLIAAISGITILYVRTSSQFCDNI